MSCRHALDSVVAVLFSFSSEVPEVLRRPTAFLGGRGGSTCLDDASLFEKHFPPPPHPMVWW